jgi:hypothetical protein
MSRLLSVLRDRRFVQMAEVLQIKFKSSVAPGMHLAFPGPKLEQGASGCAIAHSFAAVFAVDRG